MYITIKEAEQITGMSRPTIYKKIRNRQLQLYKQGSKSLLHKGQVESLMEVVPVEFPRKINKK